jgi:hypothetical protein
MSSHTFQYPKVIPVTPSTPKPSAPNGVVSAAPTASDTKS